MGIPGILKEIGKGERVALAKLAVEHLERTQRPLRIAIDAAIWNFQSQAGQGGKNPALRTLYYRLLRILALPIHPLFVYDGKNKPLVKRGKTVSRWGSCIANETSKKLLQQFGFPVHVAPGEAEAECALLQRKGLVDMVMSQDGDAIMFGSNITLRDWSKEGTRGNKSPTHVNVLDLPRIKEMSGLDPDGMILVALLSGGDYNQDGVPGFGPALACEIARAGFGEDLLEFVRRQNEVGISEWRERLQYELESNESGYFRRKHKTLKVPDSFPDRTLLGYYTNPAISNARDLGNLEKKWLDTWDSAINILEMRDYVGQTFDWLYKPGAWKFVRGMAPSLLAHKLRLGLAEQYVNSAEQISERRRHFINDGVPELRISAIPAIVVGLDLEAEEDSPEYLESLATEHAEELGGDEDAVATELLLSEEPAGSQSPKKQRKSPPWRPTDPEKIWLPETVVKLGIPSLVEEWEQKQRDVLADPRKFATRKAKLTRSKTAPAASRPINQFFGVTKKVTQVFPKATPVPQSATSRATSDVSASQTLVDNRQEEVESKVGSSEQPILLASSPVERSVAPLTPQKSKGLPTKVGEENVFDGLPASVTRRRRRPGPMKKTFADSPRISPSKPLRPIESFFMAATADAQEDDSRPISKKPEDKYELPADPSTGLKTHLIPKHVLAVPRDSLPGSWKLLDLDEDLVPTKSKRTNRVSYVNMTDG